MSPRPPEPGDLFVLAETADFPVEWAVLQSAVPLLLFDPPEDVPADTHPLAGSADVEVLVLGRRPEDAGQLLVVPADTHPLAGSADVEVLAGEPAGPLSLRCSFGLWLDAARFDTAQRTGVLAPDAVARALDRRAELEAGRVEASPLAYEAEADPEYEDWVREVLTPAHAALARAVAPGEPDRPVPPLPFSALGLRHSPS